MKKTTYDRNLSRDAADLYKALSRLVRAYQFRDRQNIYYYDVSATQCYAIASIVAHGPLSLNQLARSLHMNKSTLSRVTDTLEEKGYVRRKTESQDARAIRIEVTAKGINLHTRIEKDLADSLKDLLKDYDPEIRKTAIQIMHAMADSAKERFKTQTLPSR